MPIMEPEAPAAGMANPEQSMSGFAAALFVRQPFKGYEITQCLASGDRNAVFKAADRNMDRNVAIKAMRPHPSREGAVEEFFSLAGSIARLRCPGAARGLDAGRGDGDFFLAYEFVPGESLAARLSRRQTGTLTEKESLKLIAALARVLGELFELGNPHGNVKPSNIMLTDGGGVKLLDIGFAWTMAWRDDGRAFEAAPDYMPPERLRGDLNVDIRGDLYSLGAVWHLMLLGTPVFKGETARDTVAMHLDKPPRPPRDVDPRLTAATSSLILWLLEKDRDTRPRTPREFLRKLSAHPLLAAEGQEGGEGKAAMDADGENAVDDEGDVHAQ